MENNIIENELAENVTEVTENVTPVSEKENELVACDKSIKPVSYGEFLGILWLFAIPVVGWIACLICMFAPKKKGLKNYARAVVTWAVVKLVILVLVALLAVNLFSSSIMPMINDALGTQFSDIGQIVGIISDMSSGNYAAVISVMKPQIIDMVGEEYEPVVDEIAKDEYNDLINQIINGEYAQALYDIEAERYVSLQDVLGEDMYTAFVDELEAATNGEPSVFDELRNVISSFDVQSLLSGATGFYNETGLIATDPSVIQGSVDQFDGEYYIYGGDTVQQVVAIE